MDENLQVIMSPQVKKNQQYYMYILVDACIKLIPGPPVPEFVRSRSQSVVSVDVPGTAQRISDSSRLQR